MKQILATAAALALAATVPAAAAAKTPLEGRWASPKRSVVINLKPCGRAYCGTVVQATAKAKASARKGGTQSLIGTQVISGVRPEGDGAYSGRVFDPKHNLRAPATLRLLGPNTLEVKGCALGGLLCKKQRWTRVG